MSGNGWKGIVEPPTEIHQRYKTSKPKKIVGKSSRSSYLVPGQIFLSRLTLRAPVTLAALAKDRGISIDLVCLRGLGVSASVLGRGGTREDRLSLLKDSSK